MMTIDESGVNTQITDSITQVHAATIDQAPTQSLAILDLVMTETLGMGMHNAINTQHNMQMMASAAITATLARMINSQVVVVPSTPASSTNAVVPTSPLAPTDPATIIASAQKETESAVNTLTKATQMVKQMVGSAQSALSKLGAASSSNTPGGTTPSPVVAPTPTPTPTGTATN